MAKPPKPQPARTPGGPADYTVGYAKPPKATQFTKGRSGNPGGASKKVRARKADGDSSPFDKIILDEITRPVAITENGKRKKISTFRAISRSLMIDAAKGSRSAQKLVIDRVQAAHYHQKAAATERFGLLVQYYTSRIATRNSSTPPACDDAQSWPQAVDIELDYRHCLGQVVGPIDLKQAQPFFALVEEYRVWQARYAQLQIMESQVGGEMQASYERAIGAISRLLDTIRQHLPPSFIARLDWDESGIPVGALNVEGLDGEMVCLTLVAPQGNAMCYGLYYFVARAMDALAKVAGRARLNIAANTASFINRLQIERQSRDAGAAPPETVPEFGDFYDEFATEYKDEVDGAAP